MKGVILETQGAKAVLLLNDGRVCQIVNRNYKVGQTVQKAFPKKKIALIAACFALCFATSVSGYAAYNTPTGHVYVDINPSIRLDLNCFDRVIKIVPLNNDAKTLIETEKIKSRRVTNCIDKIVASCKKQNYLGDDNNVIEIDTDTKSSSVSKNINALSEKYTSENYTVEIKKIEKTEGEKAIEYKTSPKRLKAIEAYTEKNGGTVAQNAKELAGQSVRSIYDGLDKEKSGAERTETEKTEPKITEPKLPKKETAKPKTPEPKTPGVKKADTPRPTQKDTADVREKKKSARRKPLETGGSAREKRRKTVTSGEEENNAQN